MKPQFCSECGSVLENDRCPNPACIKNADNNSPKKKISLNLESLKKPTSYKESGKLIVSECVQSDTDEMPIKQYDIARLQTLIKGARAEGRLQVTNKRVLFRSVGSSIIGSTSLQYEFGIEEIAGVEIRKEACFNWFTTLLVVLFSVFVCALFAPLFAPIYNKDFLGALFSILMAVASVAVFFVLKERIFIRQAALALILSAMPSTDIVVDLFIGKSMNFDVVWTIVIIAYIISLLYLAFAPNLVVNIKTKGGTPSVEIRRKDSFFSFQHNEYTGFSQVMPGPDTDLAMHELGALIREVQLTGTYRENKNL